MFIHNHWLFIYHNFISVSSVYSVVEIRGHLPRNSRNTQKISRFMPLCFPSWVRRRNALRPPLAKQFPCPPCIPWSNNIEVIYHGTHEIHGCRSTQKETSGHFFADHWTDATDALAKEINNGPTSAFSVLSATKKCTQASPLPLIIRVLCVFRGRKTNEISF
jgi:hypothetical protein